MKQDFKNSRMEAEIKINENKIMAEAKKKKMLKLSLLEKIREIVGENKPPHEDGWNAEDMHIELTKRGWIDEWTNVLEVAEEAKKFYKNGE